MKELDVVKLHKTKVIDGEKIPSDLEGVIVLVYDNGLIEVEFYLENIVCSHCNSLYSKYVTVTLQPEQVELVTEYSWC